MILNKHISIIVQGPILTHSLLNVTEQMTLLVCQRLKQLFPESELILSTWEGENVSGIPYDKLILNPDPGAVWFNYHNHNDINNCNRLIVSTLKGIQAATRPYVLKVRSDLFLVSSNFLNYFDQFSVYNEELRFVKSRILAFSMWSIRGHKTPTFTMPKPYHISDWAYFGYKEDLLNLYDVPLIEEPNFSQWFLTNCKPFADVAPHVLWKMSPEQHITSSFLKKHTPIQFEHTTDVTHENMSQSSKLLMNNFVVLDQTQFFFISLKHFCFQFSRQNHEWFIYHNTWLKDYSHYISTHSLTKKISYSKEILKRKIMIYTIYSFLRIINNKTKLISLFFAYFIRKNSVHKTTAIL